LRVFLNQNYLFGCLHSGRIGTGFQGSTAL
jgi:hypothetical protein